jgi:hypothetical protein
VANLLEEFGSIRASIQFERAKKATRQPPLFSRYKTSQLHLIYCHKGLINVSLMGYTSQTARANLFASSFAA